MEPPSLVHPQNRRPRCGLGRQHGYGEWDRGLLTGRFAHSPAYGRGPCQRTRIPAKLPHALQIGPSLPGRRSRSKPWLQRAIDRGPVSDGYLRTGGAEGVLVVQPQDLYRSRQGHQAHTQAQSMPPDPDEGWLRLSPRLPSPTLRQNATHVAPGLNAGV